VTIVSIQPERVETPPSAARISLKAFTEHPGMINGAWWPRSRDLAAELPALVAALDTAWGQINRVTVNVRMWPHIPRKVLTGSHVVRVGWFDAEQDPHDLCLMSYRRAPYRWDLLVVPPETSPEQGAQMMACASDIRNKQTASALIASATEGRRDPSWDRARIRDWEFEGGAARRPAATGRGAGHSVRVLT
jgi:hypothetical protein